jgi:hypothetical protein
MGISKALNYDNPQHICRITPSNHLQNGVFETAKMGLDPTINPHVQNWAYLIISLLTLGMVNFGVYHTSRLKISQAPSTKDEIWARDMPALFPLFWVAPPTMVPTFMWSSFTSNDWSQDESGLNRHLRHCWKQKTTLNLITCIFCSLNPL